MTVNNNAITMVLGATLLGDEHKAIQLITDNSFDLITKTAKSFDLGNARTPDDIFQEVSIKIAKKGAINLIRELMQKSNINPLDYTSIDQVILATVAELSLRLKGWVRTTTINHCINQYHRANRQRCQDIETAIDIPEINEELSFEFSHRFETALSKLTEQRRIIFELKLKGYKFREIANQLNMTGANARYHYYRAREEMQEHFKDLTSCSKGTTPAPQQE